MPRDPKEIIEELKSRAEYKRITLKDFKVNDIALNTHTHEGYTASQQPMGVLSSQYHNHPGINVDAIDWNTSTITAAKDQSGVEFNKDTIIIRNLAGEKVVIFDIPKGEVVLSDDFTISSAARLFWEAIMRSGYAGVPYHVHESTHRELRETKEALRKNQELLNKTLKELAKKYTTE